MKTSPTKRSLKLLRDAGYHAAVTEHWNQFAHIRQDLFGFADIVAVKAGQPGTLYVQTASGEGGQFAAHVRKVMAAPAARVCLMAGNSIVVHGWRKVGPRGKRKLWNCRVVPITLNDFPLEELEQHGLLFAQ